MTNQLLLLEDASGWQLDNPTRDRGRRGVATARAILRESQVRALAAQLAEGEDLELTPHLEPAA